MSSSVWRSKDDSESEKVDTPNILDCDEYKPFWVDWDPDTQTVSKKIQQLKSIRGMQKTSMAQLIWQRSVDERMGA